MSFKKNKLTTTEKTQLFVTSRHLVLGLLAVIFVGFLIFLLPISYKKGNPIKAIDALFLSTSATCVTGLSPIDISKQLTVFGQIILLMLIQIGGLGFMTFTSVIYLYLLKRFSLASLLTMKDDMGAGNKSKMRQYVAHILIWTFGVEMIGFILLIPAFHQHIKGGEAVWNAFFTSISAFCNAGFSVYDGESLINLNRDPYILLITACLIILGGIGFIVVEDIWKGKVWRRFKLHTKVVLIVTGSLLFGGTVWILAAEYSHALKDMNFGQKLLNAFFLSTTARTAGFANIDLNTLKGGTVWLLNFLMFVGASPSSTGGGIKTTTLFILIVSVLMLIRQKRYAVINKQMIGDAIVKRANTVLIMAILIFGISLGIMTYSDAGITQNKLAFEQVSAYSTTGLSMGITSGISILGKLILTICMFIGRVGVITFLLSFARSNKVSEVKIKYKESTIQV